MGKPEQIKPNKAGKYYRALTCAIGLTRNPVLKADLTELRDRLASGQLQWRGGAPCTPIAAPERLLSGEASK